MTNTTTEKRSIAYSDLKKTISKELGIPQKLLRVKRLPNTQFRWTIGFYQSKDLEENARLEQERQERFDAITKWFETENICVWFD